MGQVVGFSFHARACARPRSERSGAQAGPGRPACARASCRCCKRMKGCVGVGLHCPGNSSLDSWWVLLQVIDVKDCRGLGQIKLSDLINSLSEGSLLPCKLELRSGMQCDSSRQRRD